MKISDFKQYCYKEIFEVSTGFEVQLEKVGSLSYIVIDDFFKNPHDVVNSLKDYPINNRDKFFENIIDTEHELLKPPGLQQFFPSQYAEGLSFVVYKLLSEYDYIPYDYESAGQYHLLGRQISQFIYYTNIFYPKMKNIQNNFMPHFDQSTFAFNVYLSDADIQGGTSFYNLKHNGNEYSNIDRIMEIEEESDRVAIRDKLNSMNTIKKDSPEFYEPIEEDDLFVKYHTIPYKFNRFVLYPGVNWHTVDYNAAKETDLRYSMSGIYSPIKDEMN
jgi:hypothetical protein